MSGHAAILGDFANYRPVLSRKVLQLIIEVPIEAQQEVFHALGYPTGGGSVPVAIARIETPQPPSERPSPDEAAEQGAGDLSKRPPPKPSPAVRDAGIVCKEQEFWRFLNEETLAPYWIKGLVESEEGAAAYVRLRSGVSSRRDILPGSEAEHAWNVLFLAYGAWRARQK